MRGLVARAAMTCALAVALLAAGRSEAPAASYGLVASNANFVPGNTIEERTANYRRLYDAGVRAIRLDMTWTEVQPPGFAPDRFDFSSRDREVAAVRAAGLKIIGILGYGNPDYSTFGGLLAKTPLSGGIPPFYVGSAFVWPPDDPEPYVRYARATAAHFADDAIAWEVWNEENEGWRFWPPHERPGAYADLLCAAYPAIKTGDPNTLVLFGGVFFPAVAGLPGQSGPQFVRNAYRAHPGLGRCYDAMAYHPYPYPFTAPELDVPIRGSVLAAADAMRAAVRSGGEGDKPLWITEVGWPTHDRTYGVPERKQAQYVARMLAATFAQGLPVLTFYTYGDYDDPTGANQEAWFGFFRPDNSPKPSYDALRTFTTVFRGAHFVADQSRALGLPPGKLLLGGRGFALRYARGATTITAAWLANESAAEGQGGAPAGGTFTPATVPLSLPVSAPQVKVVDYMGAPRTIDAVNGHVRLLVGAGPVYVIDKGSAP
jgi:hypothetical protein